LRNGQQKSAAQDGVSIMDSDDLEPRRPGDPLGDLLRQDLDPLSVDEIEARIAALKAEIHRCEAHKSRANAHRNDAEALFRK